MDHVFKTGAHVIFVDSCRQPHDALITNCWGAEGKTLDEYKKAYDAKNSPCINLVYVEGDALRTDSYGRQIGRETSVSHGDSQSPPRMGNYWLWPDEV